MRVDLFWHFVTGQILGTFFRVMEGTLEACIGFGNFLFVAKELSDVTFDWSDIIGSNLGLLIGWF